MLIQFGNKSIIQLKNLRVLEIIETNIETGFATYQVREITIGTNSNNAYASHLNTNDVIEKITRLSNNSNTYFVTWSIDDVLALDKRLSRKHARLALLTAIKNHNPTVGINFEVITKECENVFKIIENDII